MAWHTVQQQRDWILMVGWKNVWCTAHRRWLMNPFAHATMALCLGLDGRCEYVDCEAWQDSPQVTPCVLVARMVPAANSVQP